MLKVTALSSDARQTSERYDGAIDGLLWKIVPDSLKNDLQFSFGFGLGLVGLILFSNGSLDMKIKRIKIWLISLRAVTSLV